MKIRFLINLILSIDYFNFLSIESIMTNYMGYYFSMANVEGESGA
jgi:hypothetical protein